MESLRPARILVITDRAQGDHALLDAIRARAADGPVRVRVVVPNPAPAEWHLMDPQRRDQAAAAERVLALALPAIEDAAGGPVIGTVSIRHDPMDAIEETLHDEPFDEIMITKVSHGLGRWLHLDLPHRLAHFGLPVFTVDTEAKMPEPAR